MQTLNYETKSELEMLINISVRYWERGGKTQDNLNIHQMHVEQFLAQCFLYMFWQYHKKWQIMEHKKIEVRDSYPFYFFIEA